MTLLLILICYNYELESTDIQTIIITSYLFINYLKKLFIKFIY